jgi:hypothetical protein
MKRIDKLLAAFVLGLAVSYPPAPSVAQQAPPMSRARRRSTNAAPRPRNMSNIPGATWSSRSIAPAWRDTARRSSAGFSGQRSGCAQPAWVMRVSPNVRGDRAISLRKPTLESRFWHIASVQHDAPIWSHSRRDC